MSKKKIRSPKKEQPADYKCPFAAGTKPDNASIEAVAQHLVRIHNEFSAKLLTLQQTADRNRKATISFSRALYQVVRPFRLIAFIAKGVVHPVQQIKILRDSIYIYRSGKFDNNFYLQRYPEVAAGGFNPILHFCCIGWHDKRNPSAAFITARYMQLNPDVTASGMNPFYHYLRYGRKESWRGKLMAAAPSGPANAAVKRPEEIVTRMPFTLQNDSLTDEKLTSISDKISEGLYGSL